MKDPLSASTSKGNQGTTRGKEKIVRIRSIVTLPTELRGRTEKVSTVFPTHWLSRGGE